MEEKSVFRMHLCRGDSSVHSQLPTNSERMHKDDTAERGMLSRLCQ